MAAPRGLTNITNHKPVGALCLLAPAAHSGERPVHEAIGVPDGKENTCPKRRCPLPRCSLGTYRRVGGPGVMERCAWATTAGWLLPFPGLRHTHESMLRAVPIKDSMPLGQRRRISRLPRQGWVMVTVTATCSRVLIPDRARSASVTEGRVLSGSEHQSLLGKE